MASEVDAGFRVYVSGFRVSGLCSFGFTLRVLEGILFDFGLLGLIFTVVGSITAVEALGSMWRDLRGFRVVGFGSFVFIVYLNPEEPTFLRAYIRKS